MRTTIGYAAQTTLVAAIAIVRWPPFGASCAGASSENMSPDQGEAVVRKALRASMTVASPPYWALFGLWDAKEILVGRNEKSWQC
jgi:hypothetical protein